MKCVILAGLILALVSLATANPQQPSGADGSTPAANASAALKVSPSSLNFGVQVLGNTSVARNTKLTNLGTTALDITGVTTSGDFGIAGNTCGSVLAAGAACTISITLTASASVLAPGRSPSPTPEGAARVS